MPDDLNYHNLAKLAFETHYAERRKDPDNKHWLRGESWVMLSPVEQQAWIRVVEVVIATVSAADLA